VTRQVRAGASHYARITVAGTRPDKPLRADDFEVTEADDGYVVYHPAQDRVHYLNHTAALVLEFCTGENETTEIVQIIQDAYELPEPPDKEIRECLGQLREEGLIS
jgi:Coenzyme PQQ synthesis protein D (PqqD)